MTLYQFKLLEEMEQIETIWNSVLLVKRQDEKFEYELYQIDGFYAELKFEKGERMTGALKLFTNPDVLEPYFPQIDIVDLVSKDGI